MFPLSQKVIAFGIAIRETIACCNNMVIMSAAKLNAILVGYASRATRQQGHASRASQQQGHASRASQQQALSWPESWRHRVSGPIISSWATPSVRALHFLELWNAGQGRVPALHMH